MTVLRNMIMNASKAIDDNTALFYQQKKREGYAMLDSTLAILVQTTNELLNIHKDIEIKDSEQQKLNSILSNAMKAIEFGDTILLSDILFFDLKPLLEQNLY